jgi:predicted secreted protein
MTAGVSAAESGKGTTFTWGSYPLVEMVTFSDIGASCADIDVTSHDSSGNWTEFIAGLNTAAELTMTGNLITGDTSGQMQAITDFAAHTKKTGTLTLPNTAASTWAATMYCKDYKVTADRTGALKIKFTMKPSGQPTWTV